MLKTTCKARFAPLFYCF